MKKIFAFMAIAVMALSFASCNKNEPSIEINISDNVKWADNCEQKGWWQIQAMDSTYYVTLSNSDSVTTAAGTYTVADLDAEYSFIEVIETETVITLVEGEVTITPGNDGSIKAEGKFKGNDNNTYKLILTKVPGALPTVSFQFDVNEDGITVLPSNDEAWDYYIADADTYATLEEDADYIAEYMYSKYGDTYAAAGEYTFAWDGDEIPSYCKVAGEYYLIVWGANADGVGPAASCKFDYEANGAGAPAKVASKKNFKSMTAVPSYIKVRK